MLDKLQALEDKYLDLEAKISDPDVIANQTEWQKYARAHAKLTDVVTAYREYKVLNKAREEAEEIIADGSDKELAAMAQEELKELKPQLEEYEQKLKILLCCCLPTPTTTKTRLWKSAAARAVRKLRCLRACCSACTSIMPKAAGGALKLWTPARRNWAALRKLCFS